jgi:hypothetical protein
MTHDCNCADCKIARLADTVNRLAARLERLEGGEPANPHPLSDTTAVFREEGTGRVISGEVGK